MMDVELKFTRPPVEAGTTYRDTAVLIGRLDPNDSDWQDKAAKLIKRFVHHEKYDVYTRITLYAKNESADLQYWLASKISTHQKLYEDLSIEIKKWDLKP